MEKEEAKWAGGVKVGRWDTVPRDAVRRRAHPVYQ